MFLPPNTTSHLQPCDQGIIKALKVYYQKLFVDSALSSFQNGTEAQINMKNAIYWTSAAWQMVSVKCIANCFKKAGFKHSSQVNDVHAEDPEEDISLSQLRLLLRENFPETSADAYVDVDNEVSVSGTFTDDDIVSEIQLQSQSDNHEDDDETVESCDTLTVGVSSAMDALKTLRRFFECESDIDQTTFSNLVSIEQLLQDKIKNKKRQSKITAFFK